MDLPLIEGHLRQSLLRRSLISLPREAVGIIYKGQVYSLNNASPNPENSFEVLLPQFKRLVLMLEVPRDQIDEEVILWHSHPKGGVGPSREDMKNRTPLRHHLVVSVVDGDIVPTWY